MRRFPPKISKNIGGRGYDTVPGLSKANDSANPAANNKLLHVIKYVLEMKSLGLKIKPTGNSNNPWEVDCFEDNDYAGDPMSRRSIMYVLSVLVTLQSTSQKNISLSSSEVEYVALFEAVKEMFMIQLLGSMKIAVKYSVMVRVENIGAINMASNITTTCHTKHVEIR